MVEDEQVLREVVKAFGETAKIYRSLTLISIQLVGAMVFGGITYALGKWKAQRAR